MTTSVTSPINRLLRGIASHHVETTRDAWRSLLMGGETSKRAILDKLDSPAWGETPRGPSGRFFGVLLAVLHELDPHAFKSEVDRLQSNALHPLHRRTLLFLKARSTDEPVGYVTQDIPVYVASEVEDPSNVVRMLTQWTETKGIDLQHVTRIDVIADDGEQDYLGKYSLYFSGIILVWPKHTKSKTISWLHSMRAEHTFYHEIGHHVCGHLEGGSVEEQEKEADLFALKRMGDAYPLIKAGLYTTYFPVKNIARWLRWPWRARLTAQSSRTM